MLDEELLALNEESANFKDQPEHLQRLQTEASILQLGISLEDESDGGVDEDFQPDEESDSDDDGDFDSEAWQATCIFTAAELSNIRTCLADTVIPSWLEHPPTNLGEKSHGKLKADHWFLLFSVFLPLVLPEIWASDSSSPHHTALLENFHDLVTCTNIIGSYSTSSLSADDYLHHYIKYRESSKVLFPNINTRPNHHYAMHNGDLLKFWGPLVKLGEFSYERHNGAFQKIKTNQHICKSVCFCTILTLMSP